jgi:predicted secreted Zn-dependent protease
MVRFAGCLCIAGYAIFLESPGAAEPVVTEQMIYYDVAGATAQDVRRDMSRHGPFNDRGRKLDAATNWYVRWRFSYRSSAQECSIADVTTTVDVAITFPRLKETASTPAALKKAFADYAEKQLAHERGHADIALDVARRIEAGIRALPPGPCAALDGSANELGQSLLQDGKQRDIDYDERTRHGETQGVRFP